MTLWQEGIFRFNDASFHYFRSGGAKPALVMLHGFSDSAKNCEVFARDFVVDYDVVLIDERGHGGSSAAPATYSITDQGHDMAGVIQGLGLVKPVVFGHSMGAATAVQIAALYPDLLSRVILEDPPYRAVHVQGDSSGWRGWLSLYKTKPHGEQLEQALREQPHWHPDENASWAESKMQFDLSTFDTPLFTSAHEWRTLIPQITIPGLLITGDAQHGAIVTSEVAQEMPTLWPLLTVVHIEGAGHSIRRDQPAAVREAVKAYLQTQNS